MLSDICASAKSMKLNFSVPQGSALKDKVKELSCCHENDARTKEIDGHFLFCPDSPNPPLLKVRFTMPRDGGLGEETSLKKFDF